MSLNDHNFVTSLSQKMPSLALMNKLKVNFPPLLGFIHEQDVALFLWVMDRKYLALWARLCRIISFTANGFLYPILGLTLWFTSEEQGKLFVLTLSLAFLLERPLYLLLKKGLKRNRPADALVNYQSFIIPSDQFSFPSGHTSGAFATATALAMYFPETSLFVYGWAILTGASRVTLGVHFPTDILAGAVMGTGLTLLASMSFIQ